MFKKNDVLALGDSDRHHKYVVVKDQTDPWIVKVRSEDGHERHMSITNLRPWIGKWEERFLDLAEHISRWSYDPSTKVGAVITNSDRTIVSLGYNGFPRGVTDYSDRYEDRPTKHKMVVHAEMNAILTANRSLSGTSIYVSPLFPCTTCAGAIIQAGIKRVFARIYEIKNPMWETDMKLSQTMFEEAGVEFILDDRRIKIDDNACTCNARDVQHCFAQHEPHCCGADMGGTIEAQAQTGDQAQTGGEAFYQEAKSSTFLVGPCISINKRD